MSNIFQKVTNFNDAIEIINGVDSSIHLIVLVGLPNSGKSYFKSKVKHDFSLCYDDTRIAKYAEAFCCDSNNVIYNKAFDYCVSTGIDAVGLTLQELHALSKKVELCKSMSIVVDGTHMSKKSRNKVISNFFTQNLKKKNLTSVTISYVIVMRDYENTVNNQREGKLIPLHAYKSMINSWQDINHEECAVSNAKYNIITAINDF